MSDDIQRLSEELARDPASLVFLELGERLRRRREFDLALRIAVRGLERHSHSAEAHDLLARICVDKGDLQRACDEWDVVLRLAPNHVGARKGIGYVLFKQGRAGEAEEHLSMAATLDPGDVTIARALAMVRERGRAVASEGGIDSAETADRDAHADRNGGSADAEANAKANGEQPLPMVGAAGPEDARMLFADVLGHGEHTALLVDGDGLVTAGIYVTAGGDDITHEIGAVLSAIREEAERAAQYVTLGHWQSVVIEAEGATIALAPTPHGSTLMLAAAVSVPLGLVQRTLERCRSRAVQWMEDGR